MTWFYYLVAAGFGLIFGSFFNVCIYRIPQKMSLGDRSICPNCGVRINWYDNVPVLSFIILRGKCRNCAEKISRRYPTVELLSGVLFASTYWWSINVVPGQLEVKGGDFVPEILIGLLLVSVLIIVSFIDIDHGIIPNVVIFPGTAGMFILVTVLALYRGEPMRIVQSVATGVGIFAVLLGISVVYGLLRLKNSDNVNDEDDAGESPSPGDGEADLEQGEGERQREIPIGMGFGDFKLVLFIGLALGYFNWIYIFFAVFIASLATVTIAIIFHIPRKNKISFGPFLAIGCIAALYWGPSLYSLLTNY